MGKYWLKNEKAGALGTLTLSSMHQDNPDANFENYIYGDERDYKQLSHIMNLIKVVIKANYTGAQNWFMDLPEEYNNLIEKFKIERENLTSNSN